MQIAGIEVTIIRSTRKTVSIFVERDGSLSARVPKEMPKEEIQSVLASKEYQIHKNLAEWATLNETKILREYVSGQSFLYLGRNYRLTLVDDEYDSLVLKNGFFLLPKSKKMAAKGLFKEFYKHKLTEKIQPLIIKFQQKMGVQSNAIRVMELGNRWASCTNKKDLNFHWKCAMAPMNVLHYIIVHELAHLIHDNHSHAFWNTVDKVLPSYHKEKEWLRQYGAQMDL
jgi:predicted metal-dependent hydrolase